MATSEADPSALDGRGVRKRNGPIGRNGDVGQIVDLDDVLGLEAPALAVTPPLTLPDRDRRLECVDAEPRRSERFGPVRRRGDHDDGAVADDELTHSVQHHQPADLGPTLPGLARECGQARRDLRLVCLVLELVDVGPITAVVASHAGEQNHRTAVGPMGPLEGLGNGEWSGREPHPVIARHGNVHGTHRTDRPAIRCDWWGCSVWRVTGLEDEEFGEEDDFRAVPHPDDRLWRHPAEVAAMRAAHAAAETAKVPVVTVDDPARRRRTQLTLLAAAGVVVVGAAALTAGVLSSPSTPPAAVQPVAAAPIADVEVALAETGSTEERLAATLHAEVAASLPRIQAATDYGMREGSGLFVSASGYIVTSAGLVDGAEYLLAWTDDGGRWEATVVATDPVSDIAVLHIEGDDWPPARIGSDRSPYRGQYALSIDYVGGTLHVGEVVSVADAVNIEPNLTATRIGVEVGALPGSAILDDAGFVIAMATAHDSTAATPAWMIERVALDLITGGTTSHSWLGVQVRSDDGGPGLAIDVVTGGSPAHQAGLEVGDVVEWVNGAEASGGHVLLTAVETSRPGDTLALGILRDGEQHQLTVTLGTLGD